MSYFPDRPYLEREISESRLPGSPLIADQFRPHVAVEAYAGESGTDLFVVQAYAGYGAEDAADIVQSPLGEYVPWTQVQVGLRQLGHGRRRIARAMRTSEKRGSLRHLQPDALHVAHVMGRAVGERYVRAKAEVVSYDGAQARVEQYLRDISSDELKSILEKKLGISIDTKRFANWRRAHRKQPGETDVLQVFFATLRAEMKREGYRVDDQSDVLENLTSEEYDDVEWEIWQKLFRVFDLYRHHPQEDLPPDTPYVRAHDIPPSVPDDVKTRLGLSHAALMAFLREGYYKGNVSFHFPGIGYELRPVLIWQRDQEGRRQFRFDTARQGYTREPDTVFYRSPILGAAAIAGVYGDFNDYRTALTRLSPFVRMPRNTSPSPRDRAGLWPLVASRDQSMVLDNPYIHGIEELVRKSRAD